MSPLWAKELVRAFVTFRPWFWCCLLTSFSHSFSSTSLVAWSFSYTHNTLIHASSFPLNVLPGIVFKICTTNVRGHSTRTELILVIRTAFRKRNFLSVSVALVVCNGGCWSKLLPKFISQCWLMKTIVVVFVFVGGVIIYLANWPYVKLNCTRGLWGHCERAMN